MKEYLNKCHFHIELVFMAVFILSSLFYISFIFYLLFFCCFSHIPKLQLFLYELS